MKPDAKAMQRAHAKETKRARVKLKHGFSFILPVCISLLFVSFVYAAIHFGSGSNAELLASESISSNSAPSGLQSASSDAALNQTLNKRPSAVSATLNVSGENTDQLNARGDDTSNLRENRTQTQNLVSLLGYDPNADVIPSPSVPKAISTHTESSVLLGEVRNGVAQHFDQDAFNSIIVTTLADGTVPGRLS